MSDRPHYFRLGAFVLMGTALLVFGLIVFGGGQAFKKKAFCETYVDGSVQGIDIGSAVKFRGVQIGRVSAVDFTFNLYDLDTIDQALNYVVLTMEIDREISPGMFVSGMKEILHKNIADGLRVRIEPQGITGLNYLDFGYVDPKRFPPLQISWKPKNFYVPYAPGEITNFLDSINNIMREVEDFNIGEFTRSGSELLNNLNNAVLEARVGSVSSQLQDLITELRAAVKDARIEALSQKAQGLLEGLQESNARIETLLKNLEPSTQLNAAQIQEVVANAAAISENLRQLSVEVKDRPSLLLWGSPSAAEKGKPSSPSSAPRQRRVIPTTPGSGPSF